MPPTIDWYHWRGSVVPRQQSVAAWMPTKPPPAAMYAFRFAYSVSLKLSLPVVESKMTAL